MNRRLAIGVVAYEMEGTATGVGRYLEGLLGGLAHDAARLDQTIELTLFMKGDPFDHALFDRADDDVRIVPVFDRRPRARPILWEQLRLPSLLRQHDLDLVFSPSYSLPPRRDVAAIVTIHDLSFERLPEAFPFRERWRRRILARRAARRADRVLADTETIAAELRRTYRLPADKVAIVPLAVDPRFHAATKSGDRAATEALGLDTPFILVLGTLLDRRRVDAVIDAFDRLIEAGDAPEGLILAIAGRNRLRDPSQLDTWIRGARHSDRIVRIDWVPERDLPALYRQAAVAVYLSTYEGFGLPPLEALACGTPAVVSTGLGLDDLWPDYPLRVEGFGPETIAASLRDALGTAGQTVAEDGPARMAARDWRGAADRFLEIVRSVVGTPDRDRGAAS